MMSESSDGETAMLSPLKRTDPMRAVFVTPEEHACFMEWQRTREYRGALTEELIGRVEAARLLSPEHEGHRVQLIPWERLFFVRIESRPIRKVYPVMLALIKDVLDGAFEFPESQMYSRFGEWASGKTGDLYAISSLGVMIIGYRPRDPSIGWGIIMPIGVGQRPSGYALTLRGFEAYRFEPRDAPTSGVHIGRPRKNAQADSAPAPSTPPAPLVVLQDEDEATLLRALWQKRKQDADAEIVKLEQELDAAQERISSILDEIKMSSG